MEGRTDFTAGGSAQKCEFSADREIVRRRRFRKRKLRAIKEQMERKRGLAALFVISNVAVGEQRRC